MAAVPNINFSKYPLKDIPQPHVHDVLCGRGGGTNNHIGNAHWRMLVAANKQLYITLPKRQKMLLSRSIVNAVRSQNPPGRFLQKDNKSNLWFDVGDQRAQEKTSQALREGAPDIRKKVGAAQEGETDADSATNFVSEEGDNHEEGTPQSASENKNEPVVVSLTSESSEAPPSTHGDKATSSVASSIASVPTDRYPHADAAGLSSSSGGTPGMMPYEQYFQNYYFGGTLGTNHMQQQPQPYNMGSFTGSNNAMMQLMYNNIAMNNHGHMVPAASMMSPQQMTQMMLAASSGGSTNNAIPHVSPQVSATESAATSNMGPSQDNYHHQQQSYSNHHRQQDNSEPLSMIHGASVATAPATFFPTFDEYAQAPQSLEPAGLSYGSISMSESEMKRLQAADGSSSRLSNLSNSVNDVYLHNNNSNNRISSNLPAGSNDNIAPAALDGLEPTGISFGDTSMMSVGTNNLMKLEDTGTSFGTMMSYNTIKAGTVDGGLVEAVGTSFGSLSLDPNNREALFRALELYASGPDIPPMYHSEEKATGNLLDCSDTESENSEDKEKLQYQKSQAWERMKVATDTKLKEQSSKGSVSSHDLMPPPVGIFQTFPQRHASIPAKFVDTDVAIPTTTLENNFSALSAWSAADDFDAVADEEAAVAAPPLPQPLNKEDSW